jgi:hypothetical protein
VSDSINKLEVTVNDMRRLHDEIIHNPLAHPPGGIFAIRNRNVKL